MYSEVNATDVTYYINKINSLLDGKEKIKLNEDALTPEVANSLTKSLENIYFKLQNKKDKEFEEKMKRQRYERGYADSDV